MSRLQLLSRALVPHPPAYEKGVGLDYSKALAGRAQTLSLWFMVIGWVLVSLAVFLAITGSIFGAKAPTASAGEQLDALHKLWAQKGLLCSSIAIIAAAIGWQCLDRASSATHMASVATRSIYLSTLPSCETEVSLDHVAYEAYANAKTACLEGG